MNDSDYVAIVNTGYNQIEVVALIGTDIIITNNDNRNNMNSLNKNLLYN
jgi:hypothetical protein